MADNVTLDPGSGGSTIRTDDDGTAHWQYVKLAFGADNTQTIVTSTATNPLPVALSDTDNAVLDGINTNVTFGATTGGGVESGALRVTIASDSTGVVSVDDNGGALTVDNGGTFVVQEDGAALTALQLIDDVVFADAAAFTVGSNKGNVIMAVATSNTVTSGKAAALKIDTSRNLAVDLAATSGATLNTADVTITGSLPAGTAAIGKLAANSGVDIGDVDVTSIAAGSNLIGDVGVSGARTSGGTTPYRNIDVDETEDAVKASAGQLYWLHAMNLSNAVLYLQFYNATTANTTVGSTTPALTFPLATQGNTNGAGFVLDVTNGIAFDTAITIAATTTPGGNSGPAANLCIVNLGYA